MKVKSNYPRSVATTNYTMKTSNSSIALKGASVISWSANAKHNVEKERSPPNYQKIYK